MYLKHKQFWAIWMTFIYDLDIDLIMFQSPHAKFFFINIIHSPAAWLFHIWLIICNWLFRSFFFRHFLTFYHMIYYLNNLRPSSNCWNAKSPNRRTLYVPWASMLKPLVLLIFISSTLQLAHLALHLFYLLGNRHSWSHLDTRMMYQNISVADGCWKHLKDR